MSEKYQEIKKIIDNFKESNFLCKIREAEAYYNQENTKIHNIKKKYYSLENDCVCEDPYKANHKLYSNYLKLLIKQKVGYSINKSLSIKSDDAETIKEIIPNYVNMLKKASTEASIKSRAVIQFYIDEGKLKYKHIPSEQIIVIENKGNREIIDTVIRFYKANNKIKAEVYNEDKVETFTYSSDWKYEKCEKGYSLIDKISYSGEVQEIQKNGWGKPPFAILYNNYERQTDLDPIKSYIDIYDITSSDFANNIDDFQDVYLTLKNFYGDNEDLGKVLKDFKRTKVVVADGDDTGASFNTVEIPVNARKEMLKLAEDNIYKFGMGLNMDNMEGNVTNVRIKAMYSNLNLKANDFEDEVQTFWKDCMYFINKYLQIKNMQLISSKLVFVRDTIVNESEMLEANSKQKGMISETTRLSNHIWVEDAEEEMEKIKEEEKPINLENMNLADM